MFKRFGFCFLGLAFFLFATEGKATLRYFTVEGDHGKLSAVLQTPDNKKEYPLVMIFHGFNADKEMPLLRDVADKLEANGIASVRFDFNGHGKSDGEFVDMTIPNELEDARKVYEYVQKIPEVTSISLSGHSQGGVIASVLAGELQDKIKSVVLLAPAAVLHDMSCQGDLFGIRYDMVEHPDYIEIPGCCKVGKEYIETACEMPMYKLSSAYKGPVLIIHGTGDELVPYSYGEKYKHVYENATMYPLAGVNHNFVGNEDEVAEKTADFIKENTEF